MVYQSPAQTYFYQKNITDLGVFRIVFEQIEFSVQYFLHEKVTTSWFFDGFFLDFSPISPIGFRFIIPAHNPKSSDDHIPVIYLVEVMFEKTIWLPSGNLYRWWGYYEV